jgi:hypothetical protein
MTRRSLFRLFAAATVAPAVAKAALSVPAPDVEFQSGGAIIRAGRVPFIVPPSYRAMVDYSTYQALVFRDEAFSFCYPKIGDTITCPTPQSVPSHAAGSGLFARRRVRHVHRDRVARSRLRADIPGECLPPNPLRNDPLRPSRFFPPP